MIFYRHCDPRLPFLWESPDQPAARWHRAGEGPVQYFADTPDGAWAEFLRHEGITQPSEVENIRRALWAVEVPLDPAPSIPQLTPRSYLGGIETHKTCQMEADRLRSEGARSLRAPSAALLPGAARGWQVNGGLKPGADRDGMVLAVFGLRPDLVGWPATASGHPRSDLLKRVRPL